VPEVLDALLLVLGAVGYLMRRFGFPISPMIVGAILGPLAEVQLRRPLDIAGGDVLTLVSTPFTIVADLTLAAALVGGYLLRRRATRDILPSAAPELEPGEQQPSK
jgi:putative tricarboxylic transport membrane protein